MHEMFNICFYIYRFLYFQRCSGWSAPRNVIISSGYYYTTLSSLAMFTEMKNTKSRNPHYTPTLEEYFKTQSRKSNPVILRMKIKT